MPEKLQLEFVTPEKLLISAPVDEIYASGSEGDMGILYGHAALFCSLRAGSFRYSNDGKTDYAAVDGGFLEVIDNKVTVLADSAELGADINVEAVSARKAETEKQIALAKDANREFAELEEKLAQDNARLEAASHYAAK